MDSLQKALSNLRLHYKDKGGPSYSLIADSTSLSESTVQRYLGTAHIKAPNYDSIVAIAAVIGMGTADLTISKELVDQIENKDDLRELILELRKLNIEELSRNDAQWRERLDAAKEAHSDDLKHLTDAHNAQIERIQQLYADQLRQMTVISDSQAAQLLDAHHKESEHIQQTAAQQYESLETLAKTQKEADERSKTYLKRQVRTWKIISFLLVFVLILLLIVDLKNPNKGWIKFIGSQYFSMRGMA